MGLQDSIKQMIDNAPEAGFAPLNFGKLHVTPYILSFKADENGKRMPSRAEMTDPNYELKTGESFELLFSVNIQEFAPALQFQYERNIRVQRSSDRAKTDWSEITEPSLVAVFGPEYLEKIFKSPYVQVEDFANVNKRESKGKVLGVPKFIKAYKTAAECQAGREEVFGKGEAGHSNGNGSGVVSPETLNKVKGLIASVGEASALAMLGNKPFGDYDPAMLVALAKV